MDSVACVLMTCKEAWCHLLRHMQGCNVVINGVNYGTIALGLNAMKRLNMISPHSHQMMINRVLREILQSNVNFDKKRSPTRGD